MMYMSDNLQVARRGNIFEFVSASGSTEYPRFALIVSSDDRSLDNVVSILMLTTSSIGSSTFAVGTFDEFGELYVNCGKVSYCKRSQLGEYIKTVNNHTMDKIDESIVDCPGLTISGSATVAAPVVQESVKSNDAELAELRFEAQFYKRQYNELLERLLKGE